MKTGKLSEGAHLETVRARDARAQIVHNWCSVGAAKDAPAKRSISVNAIFMDKAFRRKSGGLCQIGKPRIVSAPKCGRPWGSGCGVGVKTPG